MQLLVGRMCAGLHADWSAVDIIECLQRCKATCAVLDLATFSALFAADGAVADTSAPFPLHAVLLHSDDVLAEVPVGALGRAHSLGCTVHWLDSTHESCSSAGTATVPQQLPDLPHAAVAAALASPPVVTEDAERHVLAIFSSGSSGRPKGVLYTEKAWREDASACSATFSRPYIAVSMYVPAWGADKLTVWRALLTGACVGFVSSKFTEVSVSCCSCRQETRTHAHK